MSYFWTKYFNSIHESLHVGGYVRFYSYKFLYLNESWVVLQVPKRGKTCYSPSKNGLQHNRRSKNNKKIKTVSDMENL